MPDAMLTTSVADSASFPPPHFPVQEIGGKFHFRFALKNPDEHQAAKRAVDAAKKLLADAGADLEVEFVA